MTKCSQQFLYMVLSFTFYPIKNHKREQLLYITFKCVFQRACLNYLTGANI